MPFWKQLDRKTLVDTKFLKVYQDTVELPNKKVFDDYTVVKFNDPVVVVGIDENDRVLTITEYRYAHDQMLFSLPAGAIDAGESAIEAAERELLEETGYTADTFELMGEFYEYPTKAAHITRVVRAKNITKIAEPRREATEFIESIQLQDIEALRKTIKNNDIKTAVAISALCVALPELLG
jgi:ADP-ribose pyrophosphatase